MRHKAHSMLAHDLTSTSSSEDVWFVDSRASNHMASHEDWFRELRKPDQPKYIKTRDDMTHPIQHVSISLSSLHHHHAWHHHHYRHRHHHPPHLQHPCT